MSLVDEDAGSLSIYVKVVKFLVHEGLGEPAGLPHNLAGDVPLCDSHSLVFCVYVEPLHDD